MTIIRAYNHPNIRTRQMTRSQVDRARENRNLKNAKKNPVKVYTKEEIEAYMRGEL